MKDKLIEARETITGIDAQMAALFEKRMAAVADIAGYKHANGLQITDAAREAQMFADNSLLVSEDLRGYYGTFLRGVVDVSCAYQRSLNRIADGDDSAMYVELGPRSYYVHIADGIIDRTDEYIPTDKKALIVTDDGVPCEYVDAVLKKQSNATVFTVPHGEKSKTYATYLAICRELSARGFSRDDVVIAVGGGVVGDIAGFAASTYMRGISFYNIPTTLLAQVDSSIGGKTAVDLDGIKNMIGSFWQPKCVIIDPSVLKTLTARQYACGMAEIIKMAATSDAGLFDTIEAEHGNLDMTAIIRRALQIKADIVRIDERESGVRMVLNFGHTLGHAIESVTTLEHGECVALGMICMCGDGIADRMKKLLTAVGLKTSTYLDMSKVLDKVRHDKKARGGKINCVFVNEIGSNEIRPADVSELAVRLARIDG